MKWLIEKLFKKLVNVVEVIDNSITNYLSMKGAIISGISRNMKASNQKSSLNLDLGGLTNGKDDIWKR
ncbi:hypothetical protein [Francisella sp. 19X1-34]|uniref:hypothetical protein n=1 Tax=Francisella sp. 19X1-34 TaxID=3087177 RepID=UPI002E3636F4|nr:hypothetical protein [Francisella sp. 19X1-34]MED7789681.1 hypothetical protein [Francisella sp. 19X1-34]